MLNARVDSFINKVNDYESVVQIDKADRSMLSKVIDQGVKKLKVSFC